MAGVRRKNREDGEPYETEQASWDPGTCAYCGNQLVAFKEGRPPKFCGPTCRSGHWRQHHPRPSTKRNMSKGQTR